MHRVARLILLAALLAPPLGPAEALCSYGGVDNAPTTLAQEFRDSRWVVRVRVLSALNRFQVPETDRVGPWTLYRLQVLTVYKGAPPRRISFFTERNSGAFYMDRVGTGADIGGEYLLFLNPIPPYRGRPRQAAGATFVNYSCGQSRLWAEVPAADRRRLEALSGRRRRAPGNRG